MRCNIPRITLCLILASFLFSCGSSKNHTSRKSAKSIGKEWKSKTTPPEINLKTAAPDTEPEDNRVYNITSYALDFKGTKYKYGGTSRDGMDCSGLVYTSFLQENIALPRSSRDMSLLGERLPLIDVNVGDLLFFETDKNKKVINHVGLVVEIQPGHILFIHSSTSRGVIISSLADNYWFEHFVMARRVI